MRSPKTAIAAAGLIVVTGLSLSGCATESYVNKQVAVRVRRIQ